MIYNRIKTEIKRHSCSIKEVALLVGMTESGFHKTLQKETLKVSTLEEIAKILKVPISTFFEEKPTIQASSEDVFSVLTQIVNERLNEK